MPIGGLGLFCLCQFHGLNSRPSVFLLYHQPNHGIQHRIWEFWSPTELKKQQGQPKILQHLAFQIFLQLNFPTKVNNQKLYFASVPVGHFQCLFNYSAGYLWCFLSLILPQYFGSALLNFCEKSCGQYDM